MTRRPLTVAIIEDDSSMRKSIERLLNACGIAVEGFATAEAFLECRAEHGFVCTIVDIHLPGMSGFELRRELDRRGAGLPVIFITAIDDETLRDLAVESGCVAYLHKPFAPEQLIAAVKSTLGPEARPVPR